VRETIGISSRLLRFFLASNPARAILLLPQPWKGVCPQGLVVSMNNERSIRMRRVPEPRQRAVTDPLRSLLPDARAAVRHTEVPVNRATFLRRPSYPAGRESSGV
jgi:hypothetical protein